MRVLVCVKRVPAPGARIVVTDDGQSVDTNLLGFTVSPHEECAVEEAVRIVEAHGGSATVLTLGPAEAEEQVRTAFSVGATDGVLLETTVADWDPVATAKAITESIRSLEESGGAFDLILFGNESADSGGFQVGIRVARALGRPIVSGIKGIDVGDGSITARRETPHGSEVYELPLPAAVAVKEGINLPRYPTLKTRMSAKKLPVEKIAVESEPGAQSKVRLETPPTKASSVEVLGHGPDAAGAVVDVLEELGILG